MAADTRLLLERLKDYRASLNSHLQGLREEYTVLEGRWRAFQACFEGDAADQFKEGWARTQQRFSDYIEHTSRIGTVLDARIAALEQANMQERMLS